MCSKVRHFWKIMRARKDIAGTIKQPVEHSCADITNILMLKALPVLFREKKAILDNECQFKRYWNMQMSDLILDAKFM